MVSNGCIALHPLEIEEIAMIGIASVDQAAAGGFHEGELTVQRRAGVAAQAARLEGMLAPGRLRDGSGRFLTERTIAVMTARDRAGRLWTSAVTGPAGFLAPASESTLEVHALPPPGDPLHDLPTPQPVGLLVVDFATRRRARINGTLTAARRGTGENLLRIEVDQVFGNCPQYIQRRHLQPVAAPAVDGAPTRRSNVLTGPDIALIHAADTFVIGTAHPGRGCDTSHRGGVPGFVRVEDGHLWWPDYSGNNMFTTLGNLVADPAAALWFTDFTTGRALHLSGRAYVEWTTPGVPGDDDGTGRRVRFAPEVVLAGDLLPVRASAVTPAPDNPPLTDATPVR
jgi:hypothetical protein